MKYKYILSGLVGILFFMPGVYAQPHNPFLHEIKPDYVASGPSMTELMQGTVEVPSKRTLFSSTYKTPNGRIICKYSSQIMNYPDVNGKLQPINIELHSDNKGWVADQQPYPCYFRSDRSTAISFGDGEEVDFNIQSSINGSEYDENITSFTKDVVALDLSSGIHKKITFTPNCIETDYILDNSIGSEISISEGLNYPSGYKIIRDNERGKKFKDGWKGDYILVSNRNNIEVARFHAPLCYDSKENWCIGGYSISVKDGKTMLLTTVPSDWLSKAVYPIVIDPLVTGPTSQWTGASIPSCIFPNFSSDSILVTIPPKITIDDFYIDYGYVTDVDIGVPLTVGKFYFSTSCRNNFHDTISCDNAPIDVIAGGCYLAPQTDFHCALTSCFAPSCDTQKFYLSQHLSKLGMGSGCDTDSVWYTSVPYYFGLYFPFDATIIGSTVQPASGNSIIITPASQCSNICSLKMTVNVNDGVPPYQISHPWDTAKYTVGSYSTSANCTSTGTTKLTLTIPDCPFYCENDSAIIVPPPLVVDACGDTASGWPVKKVTLKTTPKITSSSPTSAVCNGAPVQFTINSCIGGSNITWTGSNGSSGSGNVNNTPINSSTNPYTVVYKVIGLNKGCSDTVDATGVVNPDITPSITGKDTIALGSGDTLSAAGGTSYTWRPSTNLNCNTCPNPVATPTSTTIYTVTITDSEGCSGIDSITVIVLDEKLTIPNIFTPNGDGVNDYFVINNLKYYPNSSLEIYDRWGAQIYSSTNYENNWGGGNQNDGVYYYLLTLSNGEKYKGFFQLIR